MSIPVVIVVCCWTAFMGFCFGHHRGAEWFKEISEWRVEALEKQDRKIDSLKECIKRLKRKIYRGY